MNGAESLMHAAGMLGAEICFTNPGTTEMHLLAALDRAPRMRAVLGLFEGVCTGAADGYARMTGRPALTLLHLGPGFSNASANLHNAQRAGTPVINLVGDHPTWHRDHDAPLTSDIEGLARPVSKWVRTSADADALTRDFVDAWSAACSPPRGVATLIAPADACWDPTQGEVPKTSVAAPEPVPGARVDAAARALLDGRNPALLLGGAGLGEWGLVLAGRIARATGCTLYCDTFVARIERGGNLPRIERLPYFPEQVGEAFASRSHLVIAGTRDPVAFFGYPGGTSLAVPESCARVVLAGPRGDLLPALEALAEAVGAGPSGTADPVERPPAPHGALDPASLGRAFGALLPEGAILVDEGATSGLPCWVETANAGSHTYLGLTGGAIGQGLPCATGAALACPDRPVVALQADGSGLYTAQALWTQAREGLDVTTVICANREYRILRIELARSGVKQPGPQASASISLADPEIDWVALSRGFGVPAARVTTADALVSKLGRALREPGPHLIEAVL